MDEVSNTVPLCDYATASLISRVLFATRTLKLAEVHPRIQGFDFRNQRQTCAARRTTNRGGTVKWSSMFVQPILQ